MLNWDSYDEDDNTVVAAPVAAPAPHLAVVADAVVAAPVASAAPAVAKSSGNAPVTYIGLDQVDLSAEEISAGLADLEMSGKRVVADEKRIINATCDLNQLVPFKHQWAWQKYLDGSNNHWMPQEINMAKDVAEWRGQGALTEDERLIVMRSLGYFSTADSLVANNLLLSIYKHITSPECRQYILLQAREEAIHIHAYQYCIESLGIDDGEVFNMYREIPSVARKAAWSLKHTQGVNNPEFKTGTPETDRQFLHNLIAYYLCAEGIFFYAGFSLILSMGRRNKLMGISEQFQYILRDESMHLNFGVDVINTIKLENPELWDAEMQAAARKLVVEAVTLEVEFARDMMPRGVLGMNAGVMEEYLKFIGNRRLAQIGLEPLWEGVSNPFPWMSEMMDLRKEKNFFETKVNEYQQAGALSWE